jgi:L-ascorbate metabolism protein UlaG (beta-lactamase superfamily)
MIKDTSGKEWKIYFSGDTGYGSFEKEEIAPYGPFDLALIGVGGHHLSFLSAAPLVHSNSEEAIQIAQEINAKKIIGMHWGTAKMGDEKPTELHPRMLNHAEKIKYTGEVIMMRIGETLKI